MDRHWAVVLAGKALFTTDDVEVVRRHAAIGAFDIFDHHNGCYTSILHKPSHAVDLMTKEDFNDVPRLSGART